MTAEFEKGQSPSRAESPERRRQKSPRCSGKVRPGTKNCLLPQPPCETNHFNWHNDIPILTAEVTAPSSLAPSPSVACRKPLDEPYLRRTEGAGRFRKR